MQKFINNISTLLIIMTLLTSCSIGNPISVGEDDKGNVTVAFTSDTKYLMLPMEDLAEEVKLSVVVENQIKSTQIVRLARTKIDYWMPFEISEFSGSEVTLLISNLPKSAISLQSLKLTDVYDFAVEENFRPKLHFTPPHGWMNDPNGMVFYEGEYHLFYQYNPHGTRWQNMSWGHAITKDLILWEHLPVALKPDSLGAIFSGSAVVDESNSAGFQNGAEKTLLAFYTNHGDNGVQCQSLAYSNDKGRTWTKYQNNPVLRHETARDFRDPKVFWHQQTQKWIMILAVGQHMEIYSSSNAKSWSYESSFGKDRGAHGGVWECPDLFELAVEGGVNSSKWVLVCNINPGGPNGGSATQYFVGAFDGKTFTDEGNEKVAKWMDWGRDHYAAVSWSGVPESDGRRLIVAWMSNWDYAQDVPTNNFRSSMSIPRELKLIERNKEYFLSSYPVKEAEAMRGGSVTFKDIKVTDDNVVESLLKENKGVYEIKLEIQNLSAEIIGMKLYNALGEYVDLTINLSEKQLYFDRTHSGIIGFNKSFATVSVAPIESKGLYQFRFLVDRASIECFEGGGELSLTNSVFPNEPYNRLYFYSKGGEFEVKNMVVFPLQ